MSMSIYKRAMGCLYLLKHEFDIDGTVEHLIRELADEPEMQRAKNPRKLARNIITVGGTGDQKDMNLRAFKEALRWYDEERQRTLANQHRREIDELKAQLLASEERTSRLERDYQMVQRSATAAPEPLGPSEPKPSRNVPGNAGECHESGGKE